MKDVYITGIGIVTSSGIGLQAFKDDLAKDENTSIRLRSIENGGKYPYASLPEEFDGIVDGVTGKLLDTCMEQIINTTGIPIDVIQDKKTVLVLGATTGSQTRWSREYDFLNTIDINTFCESSVLHSFATRWGMKGQRLAVNAACASSASAIGLAFELIQSGFVERAIVGGAEVLSGFDVNGFRSSHLLAKKVCRPFDASREGLMLGEGGGLILMEATDSRQTAYAKICGWACNNEKYAIATPEPSGKHLVNCIKSALQRSQVKVAEVDYINAHGTGTTSNDASEAIALSSLWTKNQRSTSISATKGLHGHLRGACGIVEFIVTFIALQEEIAPITRGCVSPDEKCKWNCIIDYPRSRKIEYAMSISRGFGGINVVLLIKKC